LWLIVLSTSSDGKLSIAVVDMHETADVDPKLLCKPGLDDYDEIFVHDFSDAAGKWSKLIAASCERNLQSELAADEFDWTFK
jgi:hypothetical protein